MRTGRWRYRLETTARRAFALENKNKHWAYLPCPFYRTIDLGSSDCRRPPFRSSKCADSTWRSVFSTEYLNDDFKSDTPTSGWVHTRFCSRQANTKTGVVFFICLFFFRTRRRSLVESVTPVRGGYELKKRCLLVFQWFEYPEQKGAATTGDIVMLLSRKN